MPWEVASHLHTLCFLMEGFPPSGCSWFMVGIWVGLWKKGAQRLQTPPRGLVVAIPSLIQLDLSGYLVSPCLGWVLGTMISLLACLYFSFKNINLNLVTVFLLMEACSSKPSAESVWYLSRSPQPPALLSPSLAQPPGLCRLWVIRVDHWDSLSGCLSQPLPSTPGFFSL